MNRRPPTATILLTLAAFGACGGDSGDSGADPGTVLVEQSGTLGPGDSRLETGEFVDRFEVEVEVGQMLTADVTSDAFDTYVVIRSPGGIQTENDDFEGDVRRSYAEVAVDEPGTWVVWATSFEPGETGDYRIEVRTRDGGALAALDPGVRVEAGRLEAGDDRLEGGEYRDTYTFEGSAGQHALLDLRSGDLDTYLILVSPSGRAFENDDFEGDARRSVISETLDEAGEYRVGVTSYSPGETGAYSLRITLTDPEPAMARAPRTESGSLAAGDDTLRTGEFADLYTFAGTPGETLVATLSSSDFDPYLIVRGPDEDRRENDDLEGRPGESEVEMTLTESGEYRVIVTSYAPGETGSYSLRIDRGAPDRAEQQRRDVAALPVGSSVRSALDDDDALRDTGQFRDLYVFEGAAGDGVSVRMTSQAFDTYVQVVTPGGEVIDNDDWEGSLQESRIDLVLPESGRYRLVATSYRAGDTGAYELAVSPQAGVRPVDDGSGGRVMGVFVGISDYGGRANDLAYTAEDAHTVAQALQTGAGMRPDDAVILTDGQATLANVQRAIREVGSRAGPDDLFVFFYSGHGGRVERSGPQITDPDAMDETLELFDAGITDDDFSSLLAEIDPGIAMLVLDACFSGGFSKDVVSVPGRIGFFSSEEDVTSSVAAKFRAGGYLSHFMADAVGDRLADADGDTAISAIELSQYLYERYRADVKSDGPDDYVRTGGPQTGYQHLVIDRGSIRPNQVLFR